MKRAWFGVGAWLLVCSTVPMFLVGCGDAGAESESATGTVSVALTGVGNSGAVYRLRNGVFKITGKATATASSEDDVDAAAIKLELKAGGYLANLVTGWTMEKKADDGTFTTVKAVLVSTNPLPFQVKDQQTTSVVFQFKAGDDVVQLGNGLAAIAIAVDDCGAMGCLGQDQDGDGWPKPEDCDDTNPQVSPSAPEDCFNMIDDNCDGQIDECGCGPEICGDGIDNSCDGQIDEGCCMPGDPNCQGACQLVTQQGCPPGMSCYLSEAAEGTVCQPGGFKGFNEPCMTQGECKAPSICGSINTPEATCLQVCDPFDPMSSALCQNGTTCQEVGQLGNEIVGVCF